MRTSNYRTRLLGIVIALSVLTTACSENGDERSNTGLVRNVSLSTHATDSTASRTPEGATGEIVRNSSPSAAAPVTNMPKHTRIAAATAVPEISKDQVQLIGPNRTQAKIAVSAADTAAASKAGQQPVPPGSKTPASEPVVASAADAVKQPASPEPAAADQVKIDPEYINTLASGLKQLKNVARDEKSDSHFLFLSGVMVVQYFSGQKLLIISTDKSDGNNLMCMYDSEGRLKHKKPDKLVVQDPISACAGMLEKLAATIAAK